MVHGAWMVHGRHLLHYSVYLSVLSHYVSLQARDYQRFMWILTYGAAGPDLDANKFREYGDANLEVDECYTTTDRALKYTLVHLERRNRLTAMRGFMDFMSLQYGIGPSEILGYSTVGGNNASDDLFECPGFRLLHQHMQERHPSFSFWIKRPDLRRGGILKRYDSARVAQESSIEEREKVICIMVMHFLCLLCLTFIFFRMNWLRLFRNSCLILKTMLLSWRCLTLASMS